MLTGSFSHQCPSQQPSESAWGVAAPARSTAVSKALSEAQVAKGTKGLEMSRYWGFPRLGVNNILIIFWGYYWDFPLLTFVDWGYPKMVG